MSVRAMRFLCAVAAFGAGGFAACSSDTFGSGPGDAGTTDGSVAIEAGEASIIEAGPDACAGDCLGGGCVSGICQPVVLAKGLNGPYGITVRGASVYVTEFVPHGRVLRFDKAGAANQVPEIIATEEMVSDALGFPPYVSKPFSVAANGVNVAWTDLGGQTATGFAKVLYAPIGATGAPLPNDGGKVVPYYEICGEGEIAADDLRFFWANQATPLCYRPEQNALFSGEPLPAGHSGTVYFPVDAPDAAYIGGIDDAGTTILPFAVALDGNRVIVGAGNQLLVLDADKVVSEVALASALVASSSMLSAPPYAIATDFDTVAWTDDQSNGSVYLLSKLAAPNTNPTVLAKMEDGPLGVAIDRSTNYVYFTTYGGGKLMRVRKDGTGEQVVLSGLDHPAFMASDTTALYFTNFASGAGDGTLMRVAKP